MTHKGAERVKEDQLDGKAPRIKHLGIHYHPWVWKGRGEEWCPGL